MNSPELVPASTRPSLSTSNQRPLAGAPVDPRHALPAIAVGATIVWLVWASGQPGAVNLVVLAIALGAHAAMMVTSRTDSPWSTRAALWISVLAIAAVSFLPLHHSRDLFLYDIYGRAVATHQSNPYFVAPDQLGDPTLGFVAEPWHAQRSMYGPAFIALSAALSTIAGTSELMIRLVWQAFMGSAAVAAVVLVGRRTKDPRTMLALACSPVLLTTVNDAHNDVLIGLGLLVAVLLVERRRFGWAGVVAALLVTTKLSVALPVVALVAWVAWRRGWRPAAQLVAPVVGVVTLAYLAVGGRAALIPLQESSGDDSRFALWQQLRNQSFEHLSSLGMSRELVLETVRDRMSMYSLALLVVAAAIACWRYRRAALPGEQVVIVSVVMMVTATYVMPWYPAMILPIAVIAWRSRATVLVHLQGAFLLLAYAHGPGNDPTTGFGQLLEQRAVWVNLALLALALCWARPSLRSTRPFAEVGARVVSRG